MLFRSRRGAAPHPQPSDHPPGVLLALAYPDRVAKARGAPGQFLLANGRAAAVEAMDGLARAPYLVVAEISGTAANGRILTAAPLTEQEFETAFASRIGFTDEIAFDGSGGALRARRTRRLDAITLASAPMPVPPTPESAAILADGIARLGLERLPWSKALKQWRDRVRFLRSAEGEDSGWPDLSDAALRASIHAWLAPHLLGISGLSGISADMLSSALHALLGWEMARRLDQEAPTHFTAPTGNVHPIDYESEGAPILAIRVQELYGLKAHPAVARGKRPLTLHLLSPAHRPIQITRDLPGFWKGSWAGVRSDMRGRYPKHVWPDDPENALPTARAKPRGT